MNREKNTVLRIDNLSVPMGKLSVILGPSGSGKSTLIETLGLMNNTINKGHVNYNHETGCVKINREMWLNGKELTRIRNEHFSFIFQSDFLMPYYSPEENMMIGSLIRKCDHRHESDPADLKSFCRQMGLNFAEINSKNTAELSVGQKQRLSFIRAMVKKSSVIFGDEPTGNLDELNSELLLDVLKRSIRSNGHQSALLVSHNILLSVAKADFIILLSPCGDMYEVHRDNVFARSPGRWENGSGMILSDDDLTSRIRMVVNYSSPARFSV
jgi:ABC-type lipoprotein export system ATPase subunit